MRPYAMIATAVYFVACGETRRSTVAYDPDTSDAWRFSIDTFQGEMDVRPKISHRLMTFGEWRMPMTDSAVGSLLEFSCGGRKLSGFVSASDYLDDDRGIRVRLDSQPPFTPDALVFNTSAEGYVSFMAPAQLLRRLAKAQQFRVEFTQRGGLPVVARFNVRGLEPHLPSLFRPCGLTP
jgi:hypothetical protein